MVNRFTTSVAAIALIAGTSFAYAQGTGTSRETPSAGSTAQQSAPSSEHGGAVGDADEPRRGQMSTTARSPEKAEGGQSAQGEMKAGPNQEKSAQENSEGRAVEAMSSENENAKGSKDMKAEGRRRPAEGAAT